MIINKFSYFIKIFSILILSFLVSAVTNSELFIGNSPVVRPNLPKYLAQRVSLGGKTLAWVLNPLKWGSIIKQKEAEKVFAVAVDKLKERPLIPISKGVYAQTDGTTTIRTIRSSEMLMTEHTFDFQGKPLQIRVPDGISKEEIEKTLKGVEKTSQ